MSINIKGLEKVELLKRLRKGMNLAVYYVYNPPEPSFNNARGT